MDQCGYGVVLASCDWTVNSVLSRHDTKQPTIAVGDLGLNKGLQAQLTDVTGDDPWGQPGNWPVLVDARTALRAEGR